MIVDLFSGGKCGTLYVVSFRLDREILSHVKVSLKLLSSIFRCDVEMRR